jgi:hypothetical protein
MLPEFEFTDCPLGKGRRAEQDENPKKEEGA